MTAVSNVMFDWLGWLQLNLPDAQHVGGAEWLVLCPFHADRNPSCAINTDKACFVCRSCGERGTMARFRDKVGGNLPDVSTSAAIILARLEEIAAEGELPTYSDRWLAQFSPDNGYWRDVRGLRRSTIKRYKLMIDETRHEAIIPVYWQGALRGVIRRRLLPAKPPQHPKYRFPKHLPRREMLWGYDQALATPTMGPVVNDRRFGTNPVIITEGQIDAIAASETGARAVGLGGVLLMKTQRVHLRRMNPTSVIIALDNDLAGVGMPRKADRRPSGVHQVAEMCKYLGPVYVVDWEPYKDPAEVRDPVERTELVLDAQPYRTWAKNH